MIRLFRIVYVTLPLICCWIALWNLEQQETLRVVSIFFAGVLIFMSTQLIFIEVIKRSEGIVSPLLLLLSPAVGLLILTQGAVPPLDFFINYVGLSHLCIHGGGLLLGMLLSPVIARRRGVYDHHITAHVSYGKKKIRASGWYGVIVVVGIASLATFFLGALHLHSLSRGFHQLAWLHWLWLGITMLVVIGYIHRASVWKDPQVYSHDESSPILTWYLNLSKGGPVSYRPDDETGSNET